jgi:hypothetical protein
LVLGDFSSEIKERSAVAAIDLDGLMGLFRLSIIRVREGEAKTVLQHGERSRQSNRMI